ncbi:MAG: protease B nonderepressible form [Bogoriella megaspora]|nr:MAG: protease B nonderepressible form [Bogoriella megaspora]
MKQRVTYSPRLRPGNELNLDQVRVSRDSLAVIGIDAAKEHRITLGFEELSQELWVVLKRCHEFRLRWTSPLPYDASPPLVSRVSSGLHVLYTPRDQEKSVPICSMLKKLFGTEVQCADSEHTFSKFPLLSERFSGSASFQAWFQVPSLNQLKTYLDNTVPRPYHREIASLIDINYLDVDCDNLSHTCIINAFWAHAPRKGLWAERLYQKVPGESLEVGILSEEESSDLEEIALHGLLTVIGEDDKPRKSLTPPSESCALHTYLTLPSALFIDKYQLQDPLFLASQNLIKLHSISGATDLEAPDWAIKQWGSAVLLELAYPSPPPSQTSQEWTVSVPLHLRYLDATANSSGMSSVQMPWPVVFWACNAEEGTKMSVNPFDRTNLGYDGLFGPRTMFYHVPPRQNESGWLVETIPVPVLDLDRAWYVEWGTMLAIFAGFSWVVWKLVKVLRNTGSQSQKKRE